MEHVSVFVYGTLKPGAANFDRYCGTEVASIYRAYIYGELYDLPSLGYPGAIHGTSQVQGFVLRFPNSKVLARLDVLEDYEPHRDPAANDYNRETVVAYTADRVADPEVWAYFMNPDLVRRGGGIRIADGWWEPRSNIATEFLEL
jgi:gamma-glutamylcyclotransferase (GGCT)/AIG2-like uncharacterized protein YtfP